MILIFTGLSPYGLNINENLLAAIIIPDKDIIPGAETLSPAYIIFENYEKILIAIMPIIPHFSNECLEMLGTKKGPDSKGY